MTNACVALGDPERTCACATAGLVEAEAHGLDRFPQELRRARAAFPSSWRMLAPVVELDERLALAT